MSGNEPDTGYADAVTAAKRAANVARPEFGEFFLARFLDLDITYDDKRQTCTVDLPYARHLCNPQGSMHGGILATALDISMGHLCHRFLSTGVTVDMTQRFFRPLLTDGQCTAALLHAGRRIAHLESRLVDTQGRLAAHATSSWYLQSDIKVAGPRGN